MTTQVKTRKPLTEIQQASVCRCTEKATHEVFYAVKSDSSDTWYQVRFDHSRLAWTCNCPATKPCKHERAVQEVLKVRRAQVAEKMGGETPAIVAKLQREEDEKANRRAAMDIQFDPWFA